MSEGRWGGLRAEARCVRERRLTVGKEGGGVPLEPCPEIGDDEEECCPGNTPPREIWLKETVVEELLSVESLFLVSVVLRPCEFEPLLR